MAGSMGKRAYKCPCTRTAVAPPSPATARGRASGAGGGRMGRAPLAWAWGLAWLACTPPVELLKHLLL